MITLIERWRHLVRQPARELGRHLQGLAALGPVATESLGLFLDRQQITLVGVRRRWQGGEVTLVSQFPKPETEWGDLQEELSAFVTAHRLQDCPTDIVVKETLGFCRHLSLPAAVADDLSQVLTYEMDRFLPFEAEQVYFTSEVSDRTPKEIKFFLLAAPRILVDPVVVLAREAGLKVISLDLPVTAALNAYAWLAGKLPSSWWLLQAEEQYRALYQVKAKKLTALRLLTPQQLADSELPSELLPTVSETAAMEPGNPAVICLLGDITGPERRTFQAQTERLSLLDLDQLSLKTDNLAPIPPRILVPALGAARRGLGRPAWRGNLLPEADRDVVHFGSLFLTRLLLLSLVVLIILWSFSIMLHKRVALGRVQGEVAALEPQVLEIKRQLAESQQMTQTLQGLWGSEAQKYRKINVLKKLTEIIPEHTWIYNLRLGPRTVEMSGYSRSAADLIQLLEKSGYFVKTEFSSPITSDGKGNENFTLRTEIKTMD